MPLSPSPQRGEVWLANLDPTTGREQAGRRPVLVVSVGTFNQSRADLVVIAPITSTLRGIPWHVKVSAPEGGLKHNSGIMCEAVRSVSNIRLGKRWGVVSPATLAAVEDRLRILLGL
jgi:mRNA interferase MazF